MTTNRAWMSKALFFAVWDLSELRMLILSHVNVPCGKPGHRMVKYWAYENAYSAAKHGYRGLMLGRTDTLRHIGRAISHIAERGWVDVMRTVAARKPDVIVYCAMGAAAKAGRINMAIYLHNEHGLVPGKSDLEVAATHGQYKMLRWICSVNRAVPIEQALLSAMDVNCKDPTRCSSHNARAVRYLYERQALHSLLLVLISAARHGDMELLHWARTQPAWDQITAPDARYVLCRAASGGACADPLSYMCEHLSPKLPKNERIGHNKRAAGRRRMLKNNADCVSWALGLARFSPGSVAPTWE